MKSWKKKIPIAKIKKRNKMNRFAILILIFTLIVSMIPNYSSAQTYNSATPIVPEEIQSYIFDDFSNNIIDISKWNVTATPNIGTVIGSNGQLQMNMKTTATGYAFHLIAASNYVLSGDFDIQVDYSLFNWSAKNGVRSALYLGDLESDSIRIERVSHETGGELYLMQQNLNGAVYPPQGSTSTSDTNGKLRLARTGSTISSYYFNNNQWVKIAEMDSDSDPVPFGLAIWSHDGKYRPQLGEIKVAFDNVKLNKGSLTPVQTYDDFNNNDIDLSKWVKPLVDSNSGFITETNGQLQLGLKSTASGSAFNVTATSNSIVNGDFDIQVDYSLPSWTTTINGVRAALVIDDLEGNSISVQRVSHEGYGEIYTLDGYSRNGTQYQPVSAAYTGDQSGKLRLKRSGTTIKSYYFKDYYWVNLGSYTSTDFADKPIKFGFAMWSHDGIYQPKGKDIIVGFDNLTVTQGEVSLPQYFDDFNGSVLDELDKWNVTKHPNVGTVSVKSGQVQMGLFPTASGDVFNEAISSKYLIHGDFDIQVDYSLPSWSPMNGVRTGLVVSDSEGNRASVQRVSHESAGEIYVMDGYTWDNQPFSAPISVATSDTNGKLRLIRKGNRINSYFSKNNYWVYIGSYSTTVIGNKPVGISLEMWSHDGFYRPLGNEIQVAFDNLIINQGNIFPPPVTGKVSNITFTGFDLSFDYAVPSLNKSDISLSNGATATDVSPKDRGFNYHVTMELANNQTPFPLSITKPEYSFKEFVIGNPNSLFRIGEGTVDSPYWVENKYDLNNVRECLTCSYILMRNLDLSGWTWDPIGGYKGLMGESDSPDPIFEGDFDGNGNTISNLKVEYLESNNGENWRRGETGLFGHTFSAKIKDLTLITPHINSAFPYVGSLVGSAEYSTLTNIKIINPKVSGRYPVGLIVGDMEYSKASIFSVENYTGSTLPMVGRDIDYTRTWTVDKVQKLAGVSGNKINYSLTVNPPLPGLAASDFSMNNGATVDQVWTPDNGGTYYVTSNLSNLYVRKYDVTVTWQRYDGPTQSTFHVKVPSLNSVDISKKEATVGSLIEIAADFTNLGVKKATLYYLAPQGKNQKEVPLEYNSATGKFEGYFEVGQYDADGTWKFGYLRIEDQEYDAFFYYNSVYYRVDPIIGDTYEYLDLSQYNVEVSGTTPDLEPPTLNSLAVSPSVASVGEEVTITADVTDNLSGVESVGIHYFDPSGDDLSLLLEYDPITNKYKNLLNTEELPIGKYTFKKIQLVDNQKNELMYQYTANDMGKYDFEIVPPDVTPPTLVSIDVSPKEVEMGDEVHIIAEITDDQSGVKSATLYYIGPDNNSGKKINLTQNETGKYEGSIVFKDFDPAGTWRITHLDLLDNKGNQKLYYNSDYYNKPAGKGEGYEFIDLIACNVELLPPDIKAPVTKLELISDVPPNEGWYRSNVTAILSVIDEDSESFETYYRMNEGEWNLYKDPVTFTDDGIYKFEYFSKDLKDNKEEINSGDIKIDKTSPITNYIINPQTPFLGDWYRSRVILEFTATDEASGLSKILYRINEAEWTEYSVPVEFINDGIYHIDYKSVDIAGNEDVVKSIVIKIDKAPPVTSINLDSSKPRKGDWYSSNVTASFNAIDEGAGSAETYYRINEGDWTRFIVPFELVNESTYQIDYKSIDVLGNEEVFKSEVIKIDKTPPVTVINLNSQIPENEGGYRSEVTVGFEAKDDLSGVSQTSYSINGGVWTPFIEPFTLSEDGTYTIEYQSDDNAGNEENNRSKIIRIDKKAPSTEMNLPPKTGDWYRTEVTATFTVTGEDERGYYTKYQINGDQWLTYKDSVTFKDDGIYNVNYYSVDTVGNEGEIKNQIIQIDKTSPVSTFNISSQLPKVGEQFISNVTASLEAEDATSKVLKREYRINNGQWLIYDEPISFTDDGTYYLDYKSTDHAGNVEAIKSLILKVKILKPGSWAKVIDGGADVEVGLEEGAKFTFKQVGNGEIFIEKKAPKQGKPSGFRLIRGSSYDITTTSTFTGDVMVTLPFDASDVNGRVEDLKLMHWKVDHWENITAFVDKDNNTITGKTTSFSPFVVVETYETSNRELSGIIDKQPDGGVDPNANQTGSGVNQQNNANEVIKSINMVLNDGSTGHQKTHGEYQNNTNSCSSCHQTHTAASKSLLFKDGVYNTCSACHDGTLGFYNVFETHTDLGSAGTFGGSEAGNMSVHMASGALEIKAAPGGNQNGDGTWASEFNCASCHSPHGSYSDRLLHYNPNMMGQKTSTDGGIGLSGERIYEYSSMPDANDNGIGKEPTEGKEILVRGTAAQFGLDIKDGLSAGDIVIRVLDLRLGHEGEANRWVVSESPWLYGHDYALPFNNYWTRFYAEPMATETQLSSTTAPDGTEHYKYIVDNSDLVWNSNLYIESAKGYIYASNGDTILNNLTRGDVARAYVVKLDLIPKWDPKVDDTNHDGKYQAGEEQRFGNIVITTVNQRALFAGELNPLSVNVQKRWGIDPVTNNNGIGVSGWGVAMSSYCSACHTDYLAQSGSETGTWTKAHRHTTTQDSFTCVRCHFAHGTDVTVMRDAKNLTVDEAAVQLFAGDVSKAKDYMIDKNPSSALKRYTNMSVCWSCHTEYESEQFINNEYYFNNVQAPKGLDELEGKANWPRQ